MDISRGRANTTLDIVGEAVFDYHFGSLDGKVEKNEFAEVLHNLFADSNLFLPKGAILFAASWAYWPEALLRHFGDLHFCQFIRFKAFRTLGKKLEKDLIKSRAAAGDGKKCRDILSILVEANKTKSNDESLSEDEVLSQLTTPLFAGHEATATSIAWIMYELANNTKDQDRVREEVKIKRAKITAQGQRDFIAIDLESLTFTNAAIKATRVFICQEGLRMHPISPWITRESAIHDIIPLSEPVLGVDGKEISQIEVIPGQPVLVSTCAYNRHPGTWGADSHQWNPRRHLSRDMKEKQIPVGLYSNLLTFSGGPSGCIGWKFALTKMQSTVVELVENFEFRPPADKNIKMLRTPVGAIMAPMVKGKFDEQTQMPLSIRPL